MGDTGLEHSANTSEKMGVSKPYGAECGAIGNEIDQNDSELHFIIAAWPKLLDVVKAGIKAMIDSAVNQDLLEK